MNEFIEKLIERLEEEYNYQKAKSFEEGIRVGAGEEPKMVTEERSRYRNAQCFDASILIVKELAKEYNGGWIPCSERLPKKDEYVLCSLNEENPIIIHTVIIAQYDSGSYWHNGTVIAWQPLPEPYNQKGE